MKMQINNFSFSYPSFTALKNISFPIYEKKVTSIIGPSGCGKSTLLRSLNRINDLYSKDGYKGEIILNTNNKKINILNLKNEDELRDLRRKVGMIFQKPVVFPMSIYENIAYGLKLAGKSDIDNKVINALKDVGLYNEVKDKLNDDARNLSGGQQQRLCIARAVALKPEVLLMDEPTSALDPIATAKIEDLINQLKNKHTIILVTHNIPQAKRVSDYVAFLNNKELIEFNTAKEFFNNPKNELTKKYLQGEFG